MNKLYEENAYIREFEAEVVSCERAGDRFAVLLDQTAFFPEGGGQASDLGMLGEARVLDVQIRDCGIVHTTDRAVSGRVHGAIDWETRFVRMQNHSGEHIVSGLAHRMFGCTNVGFHLGEGYITFDFDRPLTSEQVAELERAANRAVFENREISAVPACDAGEYRSKLDYTEGVRVVVIDGYDKCACCAPHVRRTGEIGCIKITDCTPHKGGVRLTAVCGAWACADYAAAHDLRRSLMKRLSASGELVEDAVARLQAELDALRSENMRLAERAAMAQMRIERVGEIAVGFLPAVGFDTLRACANSLTDPVAALFSESGEYVVRGEDVRELTKELNARFSGKGGGKPNFTQGKLAAEQDEILSFFKGES